MATPQRSYSPEFKREALALVTAERTCALPSITAFSAVAASRPIRQVGGLGADSHHNLRRRTHQLLSLGIGHGHVHRVERHVAVRLGAPRDRRQSSPSL